MDTTVSTHLLMQSVELAKNITVTSVLVIFIVGAFRGWWVPGYLYKQKCEQLDKQTLIAEQALTLADRLTRGLERAR